LIETKNIFARKALISDRDEIAHLLKRNSDTFIDVFFQQIDFIDIDLLFSNSLVLSKINELYIIKDIDNKTLGLVKFYDFNNYNMSIKMGYILDSIFQGYGIMTNVCKEIIDYYFNFYFINKIELYIASNNLNSAKFAERLGFNLDGILREDIVINKILKINLHIYSLLKKEYSITN